MSPNLGPFGETRENFCCFELLHESPRRANLVVYAREEQAQNSVCLFTKNRGNWLIAWRRRRGGIDLESVSYACNAAD